MSSTNSSFRFVVPSQGGNIQEFVAKASTAISCGDMVFYDAANKVVVPGDVSLAGVTDSVANMAKTFVGVAIAAVPSTQTNGGYPAFPGINAISVDPDPIYLADISSTSAITMGSNVVPVVGSAVAVVQSNVAANRFGTVVAEYSGQTVTRIRVRLIGKFSPYNTSYDKTLPTTTTT